MIVRAVQHNYKDLNSGKLSALQKVLAESFYVKQFYLHKFWDLYVNSVNCVVPKYFDYHVLTKEDKENIAPELTWRAINSISDDAAGTIKSIINKKRNLINEIDWRELKNIDRINQNKKPVDLDKIDKLKKELTSFVMTKPEIKLCNHSVEISTKCIEIIHRFDPVNNLKERFIDSINPEKIKNRFKHFDLFMKVSMIEGNPIFIPVKFNKQDLKMLYRLKGKLLNGVELRFQGFDLRYEIETEFVKTQGRIVGADSGVKTILTLSDGQATSDKLNKAFGECLEELSNTPKGSKKFERLQDKRKNIINQAINELDFSEIKQINLEHISNLFYKFKVSAKIARFTNYLIEAKLQSRCELEGVLLNLQSAAYRSQRCHACGLVRKKNRKGKIYKCCNPNCDNFEVEIDADLNAALNHEVELPHVTKEVSKLKLNIKGFFWLERGCFNVAENYGVGAEQALLAVATESNSNQQEDFIGSASALPGFETVVS